MKAGFIRGFLNDGSTEYKSHHNIDSLAFGHCEYPYRNLGRPSRISIQQSAEKFRVEVDGQLCFESPKIRLPTGYNFGITAASAENPDSFEVFKFIVTTESPTPDAEDPNPNNQQEPAAARSQRQAPISPNSNQGFSDPASSSEAQFAHLHNRLQAMMQQVSALNRDITQSQSTAAARASTLEAQISRLERSAEKLDSLAAIDRKLNEIQADVRQTKAELHRAFEQQMSGLKTVVRDTHHSVVGSLAKSAPGIMGYFLVAIGSQALTVVAFLVYKRRKANGPKKYL
jgi:mannose-binding lectin 1